MTQTIGRADNAKPRGAWMMYKSQVLGQGLTRTSVIITEAMLCGGVHWDNSLEFRGFTLIYTKKKIFLIDEWRREQEGEKVTVWKAMSTNGLLSAQVYGCEPYYLSLTFTILITVIMFDSFLWQRMHRRVWLDQGTGNEIFTFYHTGYHYDCSYTD